MPRLGKWVSWLGGSLQGVFHPENTQGHRNNYDWDRNEHQERVEMVARMIRSFENRLEKAQQVVTDCYNRKPFDRPLDFYLRSSPLRHRLDLRGVLEFDLHLNTGLQEVDKKHRCTRQLIEPHSRCL